MLQITDGVTMPGFYGGAGNITSGPCAFMANISLMTEPSPQPKSFLNRKAKSLELLAF